MAIHITRREIRDMYEGRIINTGYAELDSLINAAGYSPTFYNAGVYGWNFSVYLIDGFAVLSGYRNQPGGAIKPPYSELHSMNEIGRSIREDRSIPWQARREKARAALSDYLRKFEPARA